MAGSWRLLFTVLILAACVSCAPKSDGDQEIQAEVAQEQPIGSAEKGKLLYSTCKTCHGDSGQGDHLKNNNENQRARFNTPSYHFNIEFGNTGFGKKKEFSFNASMRYKPAYFYEVAGGLGQGTVPASTVIDAQIGYKLIKAHSTIKLGATNLTNQYYSTGIANPMIGGMYYISLGYNLF